MGAQSLLGELEGALGILHGAGLEELDDSLLVGRDAADLADHLTDKLHALAEGSLFLGGTDALGLLLGHLEGSGGVALVLADGDHLRMRFDHKIILIKIMI